MMSDRTPLVSVILPTYNRAYILPKAIDSVLGQTYPHFELIIVDDGSEDDTGMIVAQYTDQRIIYIKTVNQQLPYARNEGLSVAQGDYVAFCDSDDVYEPDCLEFFVKKSLKYPADHFLYADAYWEDAKQDVPSHLPEQIIYNSGISPCTMFIRRTPEVRFDPAVKYMEDWSLCLCLKFHMKFRHFPRRVARVLSRRDDHVTDDYDLAEQYQHVVQHYLKTNIHPHAECLVIVRCVHPNNRLIFLMLNYLRLFFPMPFDVVFDVSQCPFPEKKEYIRSIGYRVVTHDRDLRKVLAEQSVDYVFNIFEFVLPIGPFPFPSGIHNGVRHFVRTVEVSDPSRVQFFQSCWKPHPLVIEAYEALDQDERENDSVYWCDKTTFLSGQKTRDVKGEAVCLIIPPGIQKIFVPPSSERRKRNM